jgi:hypothetical protein
MGADKRGFNSMSAQDEIIIYPDMAIPQEAFDFLDYINKLSVTQLGLADIKILNPRAKTASGACAEHTDSMDKISDQIRKRMELHVSRR